MNPTLYIIRGLPGGGKSTLARKLVHESRHREADMYHMVEGEYRFNQRNVKAAHQWCQREVADLMSERADVAVSNTFTQLWEIDPYILMAEDAGFDVQVIECHGHWQSEHNVPVEVIDRMSERWEPYCA